MRPFLHPFDLFRDPLSMQAPLVNNPCYIYHILETLNTTSDTVITLTELIFIINNPKDIYVNPYYSV